jgi:hypothetical protein
MASDPVTTSTNAELDKVPNPAVIECVPIDRGTLVVNLAAPPVPLADEDDVTTYGPTEELNSV